jgi:hypothetical protein
MMVIWLKVYIVVISENLIRIFFCVSAQRGLKHSNQNEMRNSLFKLKIIILCFTTKD